MFRNFVYVGVQPNAEVGFLFLYQINELLTGHGCEDNQNYDFYD